ncbi:MAG: 50S ribosomal protein L3 [Candidatus Berkelbacteria bacterium]
MKAIIGKKLGMTRIFDEKGTVIPVTLILAEPNIVTQVKTQETDGYTATQIAMPQDKKLNKPQTGHLAKVEVKSRVLREFDLSDVTVGDKVDLSQFEVGQKVTVSATSKGKGFAGTVKRHNFHCGPKTHGSNNYRQPGSIGSAYPQRVVKGIRMAGHMGFDKVTVKNLIVAQIDSINNIIYIRGAVPGPRKSFVSIWSENV